MLGINHRRSVKLTVQTRSLHIKSYGKKFYNEFISCLYMFWAPFAHCQEVKIVLYSIWHHHTYRWPSRAQVERGVLSRPVPQTATYRCDDTRCCIIQFWPPDDKHMCSKHVEAWNKLIIKFSASSWLILRQIYWDARSAKYQNLWQKFSFI